MYQKSRLKTCVINFRVTAEELEKLKAESAARGATCLSDFTRSVMLAVVNRASGLGSQEAVEARVAVCEQRLGTLEKSLTHLRNALEYFPPTSN